MTERALRLRLAVATFGILALELALIRWLSGQIRVFAYFANLVLLAAFLGMGLGIQLGRRKPDLIRWALPLLALLSGVLAFASELNLVHMKFPDLSIVLWGSEKELGAFNFLRGTAVVVVLFWMLTAIFCLAATPIGWIFDRLPPLTAYSADLLGSLLGVLAMTAVSALGTSPVLWMLLGTVPLLWIAPRPATLVSAVAVVVFAAVSIRGASFSPYNRLELAPLSQEELPGSGRDWKLSSNRDFLQYALDLSPREPVWTAQRARAKMVYELPFAIQEGGRRALVVGAGTGNDVAAALRRGFSQVLAVEIDPEIVKMGRRVHPEQPYSDPRVVTIVNDARAYFEQNPQEKFDVVCYGLLDSKAMFSSMSTLRQENYVYTVEGIRAGWSHVTEGGVLSVCFSIAGNQFLADRILGAMQEVTGLKPIVVVHDMHYGMTFAVGSRLDPRRIPPVLGPVFTNATPDPRVRVPTDDWPFLYLRPRTIPWAYLLVLAAILVTAWISVRKVYGADAFRAGRFDLTLFLMGAAFLLLETRMVTALSLLFGSTWVVNASVFAGILVTVYVANQFVVRRRPARVLAWYVPLAASLLVTWAIPPSVLNALPLLQRGILAGLLYALPVAFAGVLFSSFLRTSREPAAALGSNLLGAVLGGVLEYSSMIVGLRSLVLLALALYLGSLLAALKRAPPLETATIQ